MGMSTHVVGLRDPYGDTHRKMVTAAKALYDVGVVSLPPELKKYFNLYETTEVVSDNFAGCEVDVEIERPRDREYSDDYVVDIRKLPEGVTHIRFSNSY